MHDAVVATSRAQEATVPSHSADATIVAAKSANKLSLRRVPYLKIPGVRAYSEKCAITRPLNASYSIVRPDVAQLGYFA